MPNVRVVNHISMTTCFRECHSIPWHEAGNNPRGKLCQLHADLPASSAHSDLFYYPPPKLNSGLPASMIPTPPLAWFHSEWLCFRSLASGSPSSKSLLTREVSPVHSHQHAGWIHPQALRFLSRGKGVSPFSCLPQRGGQPMDIPQPQRRGNKASLRTSYRLTKEFAGIHQVLKPDEELDLFSLHKQTVWTANHLSNPGYQRLHQGTILENWYAFLKGQFKRNP